MSDFQGPALEIGRGMCPKDLLFWVAKAGNIVYC